ncbi:MAG TPA: hypothetical protein VFG51_02400 [Candidatus Saccharimonadia bacterium]|nr:hypothetical protein [Candidatus Saccharimonadia bacterium]
MPTALGPIAPNLTNVAGFARSFIKYGAIVLVILIIGRVVLNISVSVFKALNPPKPPGPTDGFGTLPALAFPDNTATVTAYSLQTKSGSLPTLVNILPVYFMPVNKATLFSLDASKQIAASLGYVFTPEQFSPTVYRWTKTTPLNSSLQIDIVNQTFSLKTDWASDPNFLVDKSLPDSTDAQQTARNLLRTANLLGDDMATSEARPTYLKASGTGYTPAVSQSEADFLRIDIFRLPIQLNYPIVRPDPTMGEARIIYSGKQDADLKIVGMNYSHFPIEYDRFETYALKTPAQAWAELQAGQGYIALVDSGTTKAVVRDVALAYYDSDTPQNYLQPIYVFTGDNNFFAYVPAVAPLAATTK